MLPFLYKQRRRKSWLMLVISAPCWWRCRRLWDTMRNVDVEEKGFWVYQKHQFRRNTPCLRWPSETFHAHFYVRMKALCIHLCHTRNPICNRLQAAWSFLYTTLTIRRYTQMLVLVLLLEPMLHQQGLRGRRRIRLMLHNWSKMFIYSWKNTRYIVFVIYVKTKLQKEVQFFFPKSKASWGKNYRLGTKTGYYYSGRGKSKKQIDAGGATRVEYSSGEWKRKPQMGSFSWTL